MVQSFDISEHKVELFSKLIDRADSISDFHSKKNVLEILAKNFQNGSEYEIISSKIIDV